MLGTVRHLQSRASLSKTDIEELERAQGWGWSWGSGAPGETEGAGGAQAGKEEAQGEPLRFLQFHRRVEPGGGFLFPGDK